VTLIDRERAMGGNSAKASSGINGAYPTYQDGEGVEDTVEGFLEDTVRSSGRGGEEGGEFCY
jgi:succinate dehydrogenase/fumarate reductase flavoprotein subunit